MDVENIRCILSRRCLSAACVALALWPTSLPAQTVWGIVVEDGTGVPLEGATMILFDQALQEVDRSLSDATGRYTLEADSAGTHVIRVDRIGYASLSTGTLDVPEQGLFRRIEAAA
ncbi:MAG: carboxypeptidase-like regulatory domain-containing protein [Gemmatimonadota bacterium]|nr:carboxypeptidase-like regulatory domain-containing protein [Gemmatimonadota bacterium]